MSSDISFESIFHDHYYRWSLLSDTSLWSLLQRVYFFIDLGLGVWQIEGSSEFEKLVQFLSVFP